MSHRQLIRRNYLDKVIVSLHVSFYVYRYWPVLRLFTSLILYIAFQEFYWWKFYWYCRSLKLPIVFISNDSFFESFCNMHILKFWVYLILSFRPEDDDPSAAAARRNQTTAVILCGVIGALFYIEQEKSGIIIHIS